MQLKYQGLVDIPDYGHNLKCDKARKYKIYWTNMKWDKKLLRKHNIYLSKRWQAQALTRGYSIGFACPEK